MRKVIALILALMFGFNVIYATCPIGSWCDATNSRADAWNLLDKSYSKIKNHLEDVRNEYKATLIHFQNSNEKLDSEIALLKDNLLKEKEILFLLKQFNEIQSIRNSETTGE